MLVIFMQFNYWCDPGDLNMSNLSRVEYIVSDTDFYIVLKQLPEKRTVDSERGQ